MHELSIVMSIIDIAHAEAQKARAQAVEEIELDIGVLTGVEMQSFNFAWQQAVRETILSNAIKKVNRIEGRGLCLNCNTVYPMKEVYDACTACGGHFVNIQQGKELRVKSLLVI